MLSVIEADPMDLQAKMNLAEVYEESGDRVRALGLVNEGALDHSSHHPPINSTLR